MKQITYRKGQLSDLTALQELFVDAITSVCKEDYNDDQIRVWASGIENIDRWRDMLTNQFVIVAQLKNKIVGYASLDNGNYLDMFYVHKDYQRQGIVHKLYTGIEKEAVRNGEVTLTSDVSITAKPFFESLGFRTIKKQTVERQGIELTNFKMMKELTR
ncbi:GNAT family N-acetyltransferase [Galbibacter sp. EGI 63066]|uniref:GNAT family N-acetyltransferase n=1 Tax=Galbibacter sp. EGI 63066 TaxID=2993559 RepID=UPI0022493A2D|nr:GNAT family N-acetyltransferase [Galbibacter sp. EGI 63066]MCX2679070.1 GNAT family N-acetyltransferase [Galbibacter sp. EGI 63066]